MSPEPEAAVTVPADIVLDCIRFLETWPLLFDVATMPPDLFLAAYEKLISVPVARSAPNEVNDEDLVDTIPGINARALVVAAQLRDLIAAGIRTSRIDDY